MTMDGGWMAYGGGEIALTGSSSRQLGLDVLVGQSKALREIVKSSATYSIRMLSIDLSTLDPDLYLREARRR